MKQAQLCWSKELQKLSSDGFFKAMWNKRNLNGVSFQDELSRSILFIFSSLSRDTFYRNILQLDWPSTRVSLGDKLGRLLRHCPKLLNLKCARMNLCRYKLLFSFIFVFLYMKLVYLCHFIFKRLADSRKFTI